MRSTKIGAVLAIFSSLSLTSCWLTDSDNSENCKFTETDSEWIYQTSSNYEDGSSKYDVKVTVTDSGAVEYYKTEKHGSQLYVWECYDSFKGGFLPEEDFPKTETRDNGNYTNTYYCKLGTYNSESVHYYNFNDENSRYKSRKQLFDEHMNSCKAAGTYYSAVGPIKF